MKCKSMQECSSCIHFICSLKGTHLLPKTWFRHWTFGTQSGIKITEGKCYLSQVCSYKACGPVTHWQTWRGSVSWRRNDATDPKSSEASDNITDAVFHLRIYRERSNKKTRQSTSMMSRGKHLQNIYSYIKDNLCASNIFFFCHNIIIN